MTLLNLLSDYEFGLSNRGAWARLPEEKADFILNTRYKELLTTTTHNFRNKHSLRNTFIRATNITTKRRMLNISLNVSSNGSEVTKLNHVKVSNKNLQFMDFLNCLSISLNFACWVAQHWLSQFP